MVIALKPDQMTLYRARFDSTVPAGFDRVTVAIDSKTRVFIDDARASLRAIRLDQAVIVSFSESAGGQPLADEIRVSRVRRGTVVTGDITEATPNRLTLRLDRDMNTSLPRGSVFNLAVNRSTAILYSGRPADVLNVTPGGKATVTFVEEGGTRVAKEVNLLAGSGAFQQLGQSHSNPVRPSPGGFHFFSVRMLKDKDENQPSVERVRSGELHHLLLAVEINRASGTPIQFSMTTASSTGITRTVTPEPGFTGRITKWFERIEGPKNEPTPMELAATVTVDGVTQKRTFRYWIDPGRR